MLLHPLPKSKSTGPCGNTNANSNKEFIALFDDYAVFLGITFNFILTGMQTLKLNRINLSPQMFSFEDENEHILQPKMMTPYLKRFNLNNKKYIKIATNYNKLRKFSIRLQPNQSSPHPHKLIRNEPTHKVQFKSKSNKIDAQVEDEQALLSRSELATTQTNKSFHRPRIYEIMHRNKTEEDQNKYVSNLIWRKWEEEHSHSNPKDIPRKPKLRKDDAECPMRQRYESLQRRRKEKELQSKYKNSILRSYRIKTIQIMSPQQICNKTVTKFKTTLPYFIDLANDDNLKELHMQDLRKIQTEQHKVKHRKILSNQSKATFYKYRPSTSQVSEPHEDNPCPWDHEGKEDNMVREEELLQF